ncbi:MAG: hypothetical protein AAFW74_12975 [Pseudomonadota bacterium]
MYRQTKAAFAVKALLAVAVAGVLASTSSQGQARSIAAPASAFVNVNVSFDMQMPLAGGEAKVLSDAQTRGRKVIYRQAVTECPVLLKTIADTCNLTRLSVSSRVNYRNNHQEQFLHVSGNAQFNIILKDME